MELMEYINEIRPQIIEERFKLSPSGKCPQDNGAEQLFLPLGSSLKLQNSLAKITTKLKKFNIKLTEGQEKN